MITPKFTRDYVNNKFVGIKRTYKERPELTNEFLDELIVSLVDLFEVNPLKTLYSDSMTILRCGNAKDGYIVYIGVLVRWYTLCPKGYDAFRLEYDLMYLLPSDLRCDDMVEFCFEIVEKYLKDYFGKDLINTQYVVFVRLKPDGAGCTIDTDAEAGITLKDINTPKHHFIYLD